MIGKASAVPPIVFGFPWPQDICQDINSKSNPKGTITNSDFEMAALVMLFLVMEGTVDNLVEKWLALYSNNRPSVHWVQRLATKSSTAAMQLIHVLALVSK